MINAQPVLGSIRPGRMTSKHGKGKTTQVDPQNDYSNRKRARRVGGIKIAFT